MNISSSSSDLNLTERLKLYIPHFLCHIIDVERFSEHKRHEGSIIINITKVGIPDDLNQRTIERSTIQR